MWPEELTDFFDSIAEIQSKNRGGCLFFCYVFWLWLIKNNMPLDSFDIIQYDWEDRESLDNNIRWLNNGDCGPVSSYHFTWVYDGVEYDGDGESYFDDEGLACEILGIEGNRVEEFCEHALNFSSWNYQFNREEAINIVEDNLGIYLDIEYAY